MVRQVVLLLICSLYAVSTVHAVEMESPRFRIESGSIDFSVPEKTTTTQSFSTPEIEKFDSEGLIMKTDNQTTESTPFRFVLEKSLLSMGNAVPGTPAVVSSTVSVSGGRTVYQVLVDESDFLKKLSGETIPDTTCNSQKKCTPKIAAPWNSVSTYGFGYTAEGQDVAADFINTDYFRPFPNRKKNDGSVVFMKGFEKSDEKHSTITLKTILSAIQADGTYENTVTFTATPGY